MIVKLKEIVDIHTGYSFRGKVYHDEAGDTFVIQMKDLADGYRSIDNYPSLIDGSSINKKHLLRKNDILFISKGANNYAILYNKEYPRAVATSIFFIIRAKNEHVIPAYLAWYINQQLAQRYLEAGLEGTYIRNINKKTLSELPVEIPDIQTQQAIAKLHQLELQEGKLIDKIKDRREQLLNSLLLNKIKSNKHGNKKTKRVRVGEL